MLLIARKYSELSVADLIRVYSGSLKNDDAEKFVEYIRDDFFLEKGAFCCFWVDEGYKSALRVESYIDGMLLTGVETMPEYRRMGYAKKLLQDVIAYLRDNCPCKLYCHIELRNMASMQLHKKLGFRKILDYARYIDGTVSSNAVTLMLDIK